MFFGDIYVELWIYDGCICCSEWLVAPDIHVIGMFDDVMLHMMVFWN